MQYAGIDQSDYSLQQILIFTEGKIKLFRERNSAIAFNRLSLTPSYLVRKGLYAATAILRSCPEATPSP